MEKKLGGNAPPPWTTPPDPPRPHTPNHTPPGTKYTPWD